MKTKEFKENINKAEAEIRKDLSHYRERLVNLKFDLAAGKIKNIREIRTVRKSIAQILTILKTRQTNEKA
jgi:ribosomal protein L29